ncbi:AlpA family transcriptional regulator [Thalassotalea aquiviva]|uniref:AlpA family transcriptional regulator n=1 Tax=Thalassotalea aquiviva TaxID=3242415 RepID=UPI00352A942F
MRLIRLKKVMELTGLSRASVYKFMANDTFPKSVPLGDRAVAWVEQEVTDWVLDKIAERDANNKNNSVSIVA